ncbi:MAG: Holliday junction branch migration protein RuvA [Sodaliphilus sp.]|jgi:Holliday junction DNA helicase RuvA|nr:Holliday junction branch migration protein RuvA [Muribaculaceae bacterium]MCI6147000.1 Holliday junction branch migration protein RuvA [Bacteroidales bacterium]MDY2591747.1 Holliday junction branch migration protein RuvA [Sodaliphilus sp.]HAO62803.1 Holliday junction branch migration protein RuvA [Porphyromonadaceae bacterium]MCI6293152.1 Holliday junction branch migration protein RuvA [Bacteroidales bacterium]
MYDYIKGNVAELTPTYVVLDNHGVGYMINISLNSFNALQHQEDVVKVYVYEAIREDAHLLYGFTERRERELFLLLISVSGVGANTARMILSSLTPSDLEQTIASENVGILKSVKGIGAKTAERIIVDLKDKIKLSTDTLLDKSQVTSEVFDEAMSALVMLGFTKQMSQKALKKLFTAEPTITVEQAIKKALKMM